MKIRVKVGRSVTALFGTLDENMKTLEKVLKVSTHLAGDALEIEGESGAVTSAQRFVEEFVELSRRGTVPRDSEVQSFL